MLTIQYRFKGTITPNCTIKVPTTAEARRQPLRVRDFFEQLVVDYGEPEAARRYCRNHCSLDRFASLEIHDGTGCVEKII